MREISVIDLVGPICVDPEAGEIVCAIVRDSFSCGLSDEVDDELVSLVLRNASRFYSASPDAREALAAASISRGED